MDCSYANTRRRKAIGKNPLTTVKETPGGMFHALYSVGQEFPGKVMNHHQLEKDIEHLEHVIARISAADHIPLSYWRNRLKSILTVAMVPSQASRVKRLNDALSALEARQEVAPVSGHAR
jgi:hypothetical protein